ncbi:MAG: hypothetical protein DMG16_06455 [Acidobacteria bacterium]|nr:MAG: hypothetical protein DMG16_06455 [Acidobacteriota bacterium]
MLCFLTAATVWAQPPTILEYSVPTAEASVHSITLGPDGNLWFTETIGNKIGRITPDGNITEYSLPTPRTSPSMIIQGPDGNLWFNRNENGNGAVGKITTVGEITEYRLPSPTAVMALAAGADGNVWFTGTSKIGKITPTGMVTEYPVSPSCCPSPAGITAGSDGNLWFTEVLGNGFSRVGRISTTGNVTEFPAFQFDAGNIIQGPDQNLWFGSIGRITPDGTIRQYRVDGVAGMAQGPDRNIWFTLGANRIGRITINGTVTSYPLPTANSGPVGITIGPDGNIWFTEQQSNKIATLILPAPAGQLAQIASGGGWDTSLTLLNLGTTAAEASLDFYADPGGAPLTLPITFPDSSSEPITTSRVTKTLNPDALVVFDTTSDNANIDMGWSLLQTGGNVSGFATFRYPPLNWAALVPLENRSAPSYALVFDNTDGISTGAAIANLTSESITVFVTVRNDVGAGIGTDTIQLSPRGHTAFMLDQRYPFTAAKRGSIQFDTSLAAQISVLGLRFIGTALTTIPSLALAIPALFNAAPNSGSITHTTYDGGFTSSFYVFNTSPLSAPFTLSFFDESGNPISVPLSLPQSGTSLSASVLTRTLPARAVLLVQTISNNDSPPKVGSAQLTSTGGVTAFEIFRWTTFGQEASVALATADSSVFVLPADNTNGVATGVALANTTASSITVTLKLRDSAGTSLESATVNLPQRGHVSFMLPDRYPALAGKRGTAEFAISGPGNISVVGLLLKPDGTLTTVPTLPK